MSPTRQYKLLYEGKERTGNAAKKNPHRNRSQVQVSLKVTAQIHHLNITVMLDFFFLMFDTFSVDQSPEIAGKLNNHDLDYK